MCSFNIDENRLKHMVSVAKYMADNAYKFNLPADEMFLLGYVHDIGFIYGKEGHELNGCELLWKGRYDYANIVAFHTATPKEYMAINKCDADGIPKELVLLWCGDMHVTSEGKLVTTQERLEDIRQRHGEDNKIYIRCKELIEWLDINIYNYLEQ